MNKTNLKIKIILIAILVIVSCIKSPLTSYALDTETINYEVKSWNELSNIILKNNNNNKSLEIKLLSNGNYYADSTIVIENGKNITLLSENNSKIIIKRATNLKNNLIYVNNATLNIGKKINSGEIVFDENKSSITSLKSLIETNKAKINLYNVTLSNNKMNGSCGGAIRITDSNISITKSKIDSNIAPFGGGIWINKEDSSSKLTISNTVISNNEATTYSGGGIYCYGDVNINNNSKIIKNTAKTDGGGIMTKRLLTISNTNILRNTTRTGTGGGLRVVGQTTMNSGTISNNSSYSDGGGVYFDTGRFFFFNGTINNNISKRNVNDNNIYEYEEKLNFIDYGFILSIVLGLLFIVVMIFSNIKRKIN